MQSDMSVVRKALYPVLVVASIFGLQMFEYHILPLNFVQYVLMWTTYLAALVALYIWTKFSSIFYGGYQCEVTYNVLTSFISTGLTLCHKKFDIPDEYDKLHMWTWKVLGIWILMMGFFILIDTTWMYPDLGKFAGTIATLLVNYPCGINLLNYIIIWLLLWYTNSRFDRINRYVGALTGQNNSKTNWLFDWRCGVYDLVNPVIMKKHGRDIWIMMQLHENLCKVSRELNTIYGLQMALEIGTYFVYVSSMAIFTCLTFLPIVSTMKVAGDDTSRLLFSVIMGWIKGGFYIVRLVYINHMYESVSTKASSTRMILHNFLSCVNAAELRKEILHFILHIVNRPLKFHAAGMFDYGYDFIYTTVGAMTTLLVIILQSKSVTNEIFGFISLRYMKNDTLRTS